MSMPEVLSIWRLPLDKVALVEAQALSARQPQCSIGYNEYFNAMSIYNYGYYVDLYTNGADPVSWSLSALRRRVPRWPESESIPRSSGLRSWS